MNTLEVQFRNFLQVLTEPIGVVGLAALLLIIVSLLAVYQALWCVVGMLIFIASLSYSGVVGLRLIQPIDSLRLYGRPIVSLLLAVLLIPLFRSRRGWRHQLVLPGLLVYFG